MKLGQGIDNSSQFLRDNPSIKDEINTKLQEIWENNKGKKSSKKQEEETQQVVDQIINMETGEIIEDTPEVIEPEIVEEPVKRTRKN